MTEYPIHNHIHRGPSRRGVCPACDMMGSNYPFLLNANERLMAVTLEANELRAKLDDVRSMATRILEVQAPDCTDDRWTVGWFESRRDLAEIILFYIGEE